MKAARALLLGFIYPSIQELERRVASRKADLKAAGVRPLSTIDSGLYSTDSTDSDQDAQDPQDKSQQQGT